MNDNAANSIKYNEKVYKSRNSTDYIQQRIKFKERDREGGKKRDADTLKYTNRYK